MDVDISDVVVHIDETLDASQVEALDRGLREINGMISVRFQTGNPHLALVAFNPARTSSQAILEAVKTHPFGMSSKVLPGKELHAQVAGL